MSLAMQVWTFPIIGKHIEDKKCELCNKPIKMGIENVISHFDVVGTNQFDLKVEHYPYHQHCFESKLKILDKFNVDVIEFSLGQIKALENHFREEREKRKLLMIKRFFKV